MSQVVRPPPRPAEGILAVATPVVRTAVVCAVRLHSEGVARVLGNAADIEVVAFAGGAADVLAAVPEQRPDVVLVDAAVPDALGAADTIGRGWAPARVILLGVPEVDEEVLACAEAGFAGYVACGATAEDLIGTVRRAARGELDCSPRIAAILFRQVGRLAARRATSPAAAPLTVREREILQLVDLGLSNKEIARRLRIRTATVKNHVHHILGKLRVRRRGEAAARVRGAGPG
jgi:two-component system, NarL family, nitrate/nitrite response regulator NarL